MNKDNKENFNSRFAVKKWIVIAVALGLLDLIIINASYLVGLLISYNFDLTLITRADVLASLTVSLIITPFALLLFMFLRMYNSVWRFVGIKDLVRFTSAVLIVGLIDCLAISIFYKVMPFGYYLTGILIQIILIVGSRCSYRMFLELRNYKSVAPRWASGKNRSRVMIIGAGNAGISVIKDMLRSDKVTAVPCCVIDDDKNEWGCYVAGVPVVGGRYTIIENAKKYNIDQIYFCIPTATAEQKKDILEICSETGCELKTLPGIYQLVNGDVLVSRLKSVEVEELLGREPITVDMTEIYEYIKDKVILVTGGGGSIGSELCRQIANRGPKQLIIFDIYENNAYDIQIELKRKHPELDLVVLIGSVRDSRRINGVFKKYKPDIVYHAAAHKHVPLMEDSPNEAIKNNVIGTYKTARAALLNGAKRFVLISTDKAVNPTNVMGASKRLCEMVVQSLDAVSKTGRLDLLPEISAKSNTQALLEHFDEVLNQEESRLKIESVQNAERQGTQFVAVRFGNVLGSNGSVIPLFKKQIEEGGPVTVTHPDIVRYFMTIPEAVSLVLQAGTNAWGGEIFVLDMGEPVKIDTLARNLIRLSGYKPDEDIKITYSGLRPGEKLFEEKLMAEEGLKKTKNKLIFIGKPIPFEADVFLKELVKLADECYSNSDGIVDTVKRLVPTFKSDSETQKIAQ